MSDVVGVIAMAYGTPRDRDDIAAYYTDIRRGRPPTAAALAELTTRYDAIGGTFPLRAITEAQCAGLQHALDVRAAGRYLVTLGQKHAAPRIEDAAEAQAAAGITRAVGLVLAPHYSRMSIGAYAERARAAGVERGVEVRTVPSWHLLPAYVGFLAGAVRDATAGMPRGTEVVFTAHSLPARVADGDDPYVRQLNETARAVAASAGVNDWSVAWQSAGRTDETWLCPDVCEVIRQRATAGAPGIVVCPAGFTGDHLEVVYDLDIEAAKAAADVGLPFARTRSMNADHGVLDGLAELVQATAGQVAA